MSACLRTYTTFCIYTTEIETHERIEEILSIQPSRTSVRNGLYGWFLSTEGVIHSNLVSDHINYLLDQLTPKKNAIREMQAQGSKMRFFCFWESASGNGGPDLPSEIMTKIGSFNIELSFDIWFTPPN